MDESVEKSSSKMAAYMMSKDIQSFKRVTPATLVRTLTSQVPRRVSPYTAALSSYIDRRFLGGKIDLNESSEPYSPTLIGPMVVTFEEIKNIRYFSTSKQKTHQRREAMACRAEAMESNALTYRLP